MEITTQTRMEVNSYMINNYKNKGTLGYQYLKRMIEYTLEDYKKRQYISCPNIRSLIDSLDIKGNYIGIQRAMAYFIKVENLNMSVADFIVDAVEKIIEETKLDIIKQKAIQEEEEF